MPPVSPRTQQIQSASGAGPDQAEGLFEKGFSDLAYQVLLSKFPDVVQDIVTFKILDTNLDNGGGIGAFVMMRGGQAFYIPVVLVDNQVKPLDLVFHKSLNVFLPLSKQWLDEMDKTSLNSLGTGVKTPETLYTDVDIRNVVVPPITGRFSYAELVADVDRVFTDAVREKIAGETPLQLLSFLEKAPNTVKLAFTAVLKKHIPLLKRAAAVYGVNALTAALEPVAQKTAAKQLSGGALWIADKDTTPSEFRRVFGDKAPEAYMGVKAKGYAARDERKAHTVAVQEQPHMHWTEPRHPGVYVLTKTDGTDEAALVMPNPIDLMAEGTRYGRRPAIPGHNPLVDNSYYGPDSHRSINTYPMGRPAESDYALRQDGDEFLAILSNGDYLEASSLVGRDSVADELEGQLAKRLFKDVAGEPRAGLGVFIRQYGTSFQVTRPVKVTSVTTDSHGTRRVEVSDTWGGNKKTIVTDAKNPYASIWMPKGSATVGLPSDFIWAPLKKKLEKHEFFTSALDAAAMASSALQVAGARKVTIKDASHGQFSIDGTAPRNKIAALKALAWYYGLSVDDSAALVEKCASSDNGMTRVWLASGPVLARAQMLLEKRAGDDDAKKKDSKDKPKPKPKADAGGGAEEAPPEGGDPMMDEAAMQAAMQPPAPPQPSPADLAAAEMTQHIQQEMQKLQEKAQMIAQLTQRANEIAGGAPMAPSMQTQMMGAPPPSQNLATGAPMGGGMDPSMGGMPPQGGDAMGMPPGMPPGGAMGDPNMMGSGMMPPAPGGALPMGGDMPPEQPGMDPSMMGGMPPGQPGQPGMDPAMMGGQPPQPPMAMMGEDGLSANDVASQVNPQFLDQAGQLQSDDVFDAAAVASLAQSPAVKELIGQYLPNLEKALDNIGRVMLSLWMQETQIKGDVGEDTYAKLEDNLRSTHKGLGDLVLKLSQGAHVIKGQHDNAGP